MLLGWRLTDVCLIMMIICCFLSMSLPYDRPSVSALLADINIQEFFGNLDRESFVTLLIG
ncbi:hypothetical protein [Brevibacillus sp. NRS-1366]|uniref:hypothetical protein n=1 Tax=Brevibacillus sp. NRS-1366 TaxID=3233899 RepID=UPI003D19989B